MRMLRGKEMPCDDIGESARRHLESAEQLSTDRCRAASRPQYRESGRTPEFSLRGREHFRRGRFSAFGIANLAVRADQVDRALRSQPPARFVRFRDLLMFVDQQRKRKLVFLS